MWTFVRLCSLLDKLINTACATGTAGSRSSSRHRRSRARGPAINAISHTYHQYIIYMRAVSLRAGQQQQNSMNTHVQQTGKKIYKALGARPAQASETAVSAAAAAEEEVVMVVRAGLAVEGGSSSNSSSSGCSRQRRSSRPSWISTVRRPSGSASGTAAKRASRPPPSSCSRSASK